MAEYKEIPMQKATNEVIDTTKGKVTANSGARYVSSPDDPAYVRSIAGMANQPNTLKTTKDPVFDTPPTFKASVNTDEIMSLDDMKSAGTGRTPIMKGSPVVHSAANKEEEVPDPTPLKVVSNIASSGFEGELTPFDPSSLPKKKEELTEGDNDLMNNLTAAVDLECKSITERVQKLTDKQYEEVIEARQHGQTVATPMTDEEYDAAEKAKFEKKAEEAEDSEIQIPKRYIHAEGDNEEVQFADDNELEVLISTCMEAVNYVQNHAMSKDYFDRVLHCKNWLSKNGIYSDPWAVVMTSVEGESAVHPFLVVTKDKTTAIIEANIAPISGVHILEDNDTIESVYSSFLHRGALYEYIDYNAGSICVKLSNANPTAEAAIKLAKEKLENGERMGEAPIAFVEQETETKEEEFTPEEEKYLEDAINQEEAAELYGDSEVSYDTVTTADTTTTNTTDESGKITIARGYEGAAYEEKPDISDIENDLNKELNIDTQRSDEELLEELKSAVKSTIPAIKNKINLSEFSIDNTPISASQVAGFSIKDINEADWVLPNAKKIITVRGLSGPELFALNPQNSNKNKINTFRQIYGIIYKHVVSKKPKTFDDWLKVTRFSDIDHIYAALHKATFAGSNFIHYECPECNHIFIKDYDFEEMVKYANDEAKAKIEKILNAGDSSIAGYDVQLSQISDTYVVGLKDPSIWNMVMETAALSDSFLSKYEDLLDTMSFIDSIYVIDTATKSLKPVDFGYDKDNPAKSTARKITVLSDIIRSLSSDNYFELRTEIAKLFASNEDMSYRIPEAVCPKCGHKFEAEDTGAMQLLFTRHQLGALGAM